MVILNFFQRQSTTEIYLHHISGDLHAAVEILDGENEKVTDLTDQKKG